MVKTVKFGGTSLADAEHFRRCAAIVQADAQRRYVVVSAPGKRFAADVKVTDLLYSCFDAARAGADFSPALAEIRRRFEGIVSGLGLTLDLAPEFEAIANRLRQHPDRDYAASRGEYLSAKVMAALLDVPMLDAADCIFFSADGEFNAEATQAVLSGRLQALPRAVLPGFYGSLPDGSAHTFSRGGSDVTGAIVARASASVLYENWTDVSGMLSCDPRVVENPAPIDRISSPTSTMDLAHFILSLLDKNEYGVYHASCEGSCSRYEYARTILELMGYDTALAVPVQSEQGGVVVSTLLENLMMKLTGTYEMPNWKDALQAHVNECKKEEEANG